ncbi:hypothetical protein HMPREF1169_01437 [Aeromonas veronii AER397]|jgi:hypothetical protein|nr:hypothetical protein HMPREF1169_01437 [Aeromonas veronii AER397]
MAPYGTIDRYAALRKVGVPFFALMLISDLLTQA